VGLCNCWFCGADRRHGCDAVLRLKRTVTESAIVGRQKSRSHIKSCAAGAASPSLRLLFSFAVASSSATAPSAFSKASASVKISSQVDPCSLIPVLRNSCCQSGTQTLMKANLSSFWNAPFWFGKFKSCAFSSQTPVWVLRTVRALGFYTPCRRCLFCHFQIGCVGWLNLSVGLFLDFLG
jgi:hypothetical protein